MEEIDSMSVFHDEYLKAEAKKDEIIKKIQELEAFIKDNANHITLLKNDIQELELFKNLYEEQLDVIKTKKVSNNGVIQEIILSIIIIAILCGVNVFLFPGMLSSLVVGVMTVLFGTTIIIPIRYHIKALIKEKKALYNEKKTFEKAILIVNLKIKSFRENLEYYTKLDQEKDEYMKYLTDELKGINCYFELYEKNQKDNCLEEVTNLKLKELK